MTCGSDFFRRNPLKADNHFSTSRARYFGHTPGISKICARSRERINESGLFLVSFRARRSIAAFCVCKIKRRAKQNLAIFTISYRR